MGRKTTFVRGLAVIGLVVALGLAGCSSSSDETSTVSEGRVSTVTLTDKIETSGNLSASQLVQLTWGTDGQIEKVNVTVGQKVNENDVLASLKSDSVSTDMIAAQADLATAQRDLEDLTQSNLTLAQAQQNVIVSRKAAETAENNYTALDYPRATDAYKKNLQGRITQAQQDVVKLYQKYKDLHNLVDGDPTKNAALLAWTGKQLNLNELIAEMNYITAKPTQNDYDTAKANLDVARATLDDARRKRDIVKDGVDPLKLAAAEARVAAQQAIVNGIQAIAPFSGEVLAVQAVKGDAVKKGDNSVALVDRNTLKIDTLVDEANISTVKLGNKVEVTFDSLPGVTLNGKVTLVNPIGAVVGGLVKYTVTISVDPTDQPLLFGATANVTVITGDPHTSLAVPIAAVQTDSKGEYVTVVRADGSTERVDVVSGDLVESVVTISTTGNLKEGDTVLLSSTSSSTSSSSSNRNNGGGGAMFGGPGPMP